MRYDNREFWSLHDDFYKLGEMSPSELETFKYYQSKFTRVATSRIIWHFPDFPELGKTIENLCWRFGECIVFEHPFLGVIATPCMRIGYDINGFPNVFSPFYQISEDSEITNYRPKLQKYVKNEEWSSEKCIHITDTRDGVARSSMCTRLICDIVDIKESIRTQVFNQNSPLFVIAKSAKERQIASKVIKGIGKNQKIFVLDDDLTNSIKFFTPSAPFNVEPLVNLIHEIENEILEYLAVDCSQIFQKKERMVVDEVESNDQILSTLYYDIFYPRKIASELMNDVGIINEINENRYDIEVEGEDVEDEVNENAEHSAA